MKAQDLVEAGQGLINHQWSSSFIAFIAHLHRNCSDHEPQLVCVSKPNELSSTFRYINVWEKHHDFLKVVEECWAQPQECRLMVKFPEKLKSLKKKPKVWNKDAFGNINHAINLAEDDVIEAEHAYDNFSSEYNK